MFRSRCNDILIPISVITIQDTHFTHNTEYTLVSGTALLISLLGWQFIYIHSTFLVYIQNTFIQKYLIEIHHNHWKNNKFITDNVYRTSSELIEDSTLFINDFTEILNYIRMLSKRSFITGDFNIILKINRNTYYNHFYESITDQGISPMITMPLPSTILYIEVSVDITFDYRQHFILH